MGRVFFKEGNKPRPYAEKRRVKRKAQKAVKFCLCGGPLEVVAVLVVVRRVFLVGIVRVEVVVVIEVVVVEMMVVSGRSRHTRLT